MAKLTGVLCAITVFGIQNYIVNSSKIACFTGHFSRYKGWPMYYEPSYVPAKACDMLIYAYAKVNLDTWKMDYVDFDADITKGGFRDAVAKKNENPNLKVILSLDHNVHVHYYNMTVDSSRRQIFVQSTVDFLRTHHFDGLQLHWYFYKWLKVSPDEKYNYLLLVQELHAAFAQTNFTLASAVPFLKSDISENFLVAELNKYLDYFYVITFPMNAHGMRETDTTSPLKKRWFDVPGTAAAERNVVKSHF